MPLVYNLPLTISLEEKSHNIFLSKNKSFVYEVGIALRF